MIEIEDAIIPILLNDYIKNIFEELHDYVKANINEDKYKEIMSEVDLDIDEYEKLACIVLLKKFEELRKRLISELAKYPLLRSRISQLCVNFNEKMAILRRLKDTRKE